MVRFNSLESSHFVTPRRVFRLMLESSRVATAIEPEHVGTSTLWFLRFYSHQRPAYYPHVYLFSLQGSRKFYRFFRADLR